MERSELEEPEVRPDAAGGARRTGRRQAQADLWRHAGAGARERRCRHSDVPEFDRRLHDQAQGPGFDTAGRPDGLHVRGACLARKLKRVHVIGSYSQAVKYAARMGRAVSTPEADYESTRVTTYRCSPGP